MQCRALGCCRESRAKATLRVGVRGGGGQGSGIQQDDRNMMYTASRVTYDFVYMYHSTRCTLSSIILLFVSTSLVELLADDIVRGGQIGTR